MDFNTMEGLVSAFQNGMTLAYLLKNGCTIVQNLRSCVFGQNFDKTSGGYLGHLKPFFGATKGMDGCPLMGIQGFWRQKPILRTSFYKYHIMTQLFPVFNRFIRSTNHFRKILWFTLSWKHCVPLLRQCVAIIDKGCPSMSSVNSYS